jgi:hypothetical protein
MRKSVGQAPTAGEQRKKSRRTSSDIGAERENRTVGRGPMQDRKGLRASLYFRREGQKKLKRIHNRMKSTSAQTLGRPVCSKNYRKIHLLLLERS